MIGQKLIKHKHVGECLYENILFFMITYNIILATILIISGEVERVDLKLFVKAINEEFQALNLRLDSLQSPSRSRSRRQSTSEEEEE